MIQRTIALALGIFLSGEPARGEGPDDTASAHYNSGIADQARGEYDKAIAEYDKAITIDPNFAGGYYNRALSYERLGRKLEAVADYQATLAREPSDRDAQAALRRLVVSP